MCSRAPGSPATPAKRPSTGGTRGAEGKAAGTVSFEPDGTLRIARKGKRTEWQIVRGWFVGRDVIIMKLNGPYPDPIAAKDLADPHYNEYNDHLYVKKR